jgi:hypothetical protein
LIQDNITQIQVLEKYEGMFSETLVWADEDFSSFLNGMDPIAPDTSEPTYEAFIYFDEYYEEETGESNKADDVTALDYYVLVNNKIVVTKTGKPGTQTWTGDMERVLHGYKVEVPTNFLKGLKEGDRIVIAVLITDKYGRRYCATSSGLSVDKQSKKLIIKLDDSFVNDSAFGTEFK